VRTKHHPFLYCLFLSFFLIPCFFAHFGTAVNVIPAGTAGPNTDERTKEETRRNLRSGLLDEIEVDVELPPPKAPEGGGKGGPHMTFDLNNSSVVSSDIFKFIKAMPNGAGGPGGNGGGKRRDTTKKMKISEARPIIEDLEAEKLLEEFDVIKEAIASVEESGIVFIDEIDKIINSSDYKGADASSEGVQRDLLPMIEGTTVSTKHGNVNTDYILFVASGAFHTCKH
jgi:ATP-dependent HslUV protease ATP-binding subunit HslU